MDTKTDGVDLTQLLSDLKSEDSNYAAKCKRFQYIYWALLPIYAILTIRHFIASGDMMSGIGGLCFILCFVIYAVCFRKFSKEFSSVDYSLPTTKMLKAAAYRYQPFQLRHIWLLVAILLMDAGLVFNSSLGFSFIDIQIGLLGAMLVATFLGLIHWYVKYKPLRDKALFLYKEIMK